MKLAEPKEIEEVLTSEFNEKMTTVVPVWVNPPSSLIDRYFDSMGFISRAAAKIMSITSDEGKANLIADVEKHRDNVIDFYVTTLSASEDAGTHWTKEDILELSSGYPNLWRWLSRKVVMLMVETLKKRLERQPAS